MPSTRDAAPGRRLPAKDAASAMRVRIPPLSIEQLRKGWTGGAAVKPARLIVEAPQRSEFFFAAKPGLRDRRFQDPDRLVIDPDRHRKGMAVLAAVGEREA